LVRRVGLWSFSVAVAAWVVINGLILFSNATVLRSTWFQHAVAWELGYASALGVSCTLTFLTSHRWQDIKELSADPAPFTHLMLRIAVPILVVTVPAAAAFLWTKANFSPPSSTTAVTLLAIGVLLGGEFTPRWLTTIFSQRK